MPLRQRRTRIPRPIVCHVPRIDWPDHHSWEIRNVVYSLPWRANGTYTAYVESAGTYDPGQLVLSLLIQPTAGSVDAPVSWAGPGLVAYTYHAPIFPGLVKFTITCTDAEGRTSAIEWTVDLLPPY